MKKIILCCALMLLGGDVKKGVVGDQGKVSAVRHGKEVEVTIEGVDGWRLNVKYPPRLKMGNDRWGVDDMRWIGCDDGKASAGVWRVTTTAANGEVRAVFCNGFSCSAPVTGVFDVR
jgi:hypothetical protein